MSYPLKKDTVQKLPPGIKVPAFWPRQEPRIVHFGVGGFHRSHQAYALQQLMQLGPEGEVEWNICGVCILPSDANFVEQMRQQDCLYTLKMSVTGEAEEVMVVNAITDILYGPVEHAAVIDRIANIETRIVSFTITEGGYNLDETTGEFLFIHPDIQSDLVPENPPKTIFGYLGRALRIRKELQRPPIVLLSCDNIQENGTVLKKALSAFLSKYDSGLVAYANEQVIYPNSMVDRITPITTQENKDNFCHEFGYSDACLVTSEKFFQWVIERNTLMDFPPLERVGVRFVADVKPYERMKLGILNGGHSLIGLIAHAFNYTFIHEALENKYITTLFDLYTTREVIPTLEPLESIDFETYVVTVKKRFSNTLIKDSVQRIISGSTAKIPKFILPVLHQQTSTNKNYEIGILVLAAWWFYLDKEFNSRRMGYVEDPYREEWENLFCSQSEDTIDAFINHHEVFGAFSNDEQFQATFKEYGKLIKTKGIACACEKAINYYRK